MITQKQYDDVKWLLGRGYSGREVEQMSGVSRSVVQRIDTGELKSPSLRMKKLRSTTHSRCPTCGHLVFMPCIECTAEAFKNANVLAVSDCNNV